ncbi:MAG: [protein-PII] uridylyltransferase [bacterium]|nr:[protein-PII] uridylyltransferase [bacterium]MXZ78852.1 [protein-PII] uridylyltransferase [Acidimicrobiia bacterium]MXZ86484.1 [protein-PII] uridylyltransferase [Acidimicrobiia bacterium]MYE73519.1 [protein-PII] uridylyltransferase [Acidimicrobiia bacterium]MYG71235.1 [protein-PII] uridylyltransferase [Acidimicrobiia bacterium]
MATSEARASALRRDELLADRAMVGTVLCRALARRTDEWLQRIFSAEVADSEGIAMVAVGGYGRAELCPYSDIDLLLLHRDRPDIGEIAPRLWYPIWDEGLKLGHSVRTPRETRDLAKTDLDTATSLLDARHIAGDAELTADLTADNDNQWRRSARRWLPLLAQRVAERHRRCGEVAFKLEPDLKQGRGGLRDLHALRWVEAAVFEMDDADSRRLWSDYEVILAARAELHRTADRPGDQLLLQEQDGVAAALNYGDADELMGAIASSARSIAWRSDEIWAWLRESEMPPEWRRRLRRRQSRNNTELDAGVVVQEGRVVLADDADATNPCAALRLARAAAAHELRMDRTSLGRLNKHMAPMPDRWPDEARKLFVDLLMTGTEAPPVIEALDQMDLFVRILPEWAPNRSRPQRNAYHQFTVDRHLCEAAALAADLVDRVDRPDLLVLGALLHDIGKGYPGDHTEVGMELVADIAHRMGYPPTDVDVLVAMVEHHLLLPDVATRRDLEDPDTIAEVSRKARTVQTLRLLGALTEADSVATGPSAWSKWKASLVRELVARCAHVMEGGDIDEITSRFPTPEHRQMMEAGERLVLGEGDTLVVIAPDQHGMFSRVAGALALSGLRVLLAAAHSEYGMALERFQVESTLGLEIDWPQVTAYVEQALAGRLAIEARLAERISTYEVVPDLAPKPVIAPKITVDNESSSTATIIELAAQARMGLLSRVTSAMSQLGLDILSAKVQDLGGDVVHAYYVRDHDGQKVTDDHHMQEINLALQHAIDSCNA